MELARAVGRLADEDDGGAADTVQQRRQAVWPELEPERRTANGVERVHAAPSGFSREKVQAGYLRPRRP